MTDEPLIITPEQMIRGITTKEFGGPSIIDGDPDVLIERLMVEAEKILLDQLKKLGVDPDTSMVKNHCKKVMYPDDPNHLCDYYFNDILLLRVKPNISGLGLDFLIPPVGDDEG